MKRLSFLFSVLLILGLAAQTGAAGTCTQTGPYRLFDTSNIGQGESTAKYQVVAVCTADSSVGTYPSFVIQGTATILLGTYLLDVEIVPGTTAFTNLSTMTIKDTYLLPFDGAKMTGNIVNTGPTAFTVYPSGGNYVPTPVGGLTAQFTQAAVATNSAVFTAVFYFVAQ